MLGQTIQTLTRALLLSAVLAGSVFAQPQPETAHVNMYFPFIRDGGPRSDQFQTVLTFVNTSSVEATVDVELLAADGSPWKLDMGTPNTSVYSLTIPANGTRTLTSAIGSKTTTGWAQAFSSAPVQGTAMVREILDGFTIQQIVVRPVLPALDYVWPANKNSMVALTNPYSGSSVKADVIFVDAEGRILDRGRVTLAAGQQFAFIVGDAFPGVGASTGSLLVRGVDRPHDIVVGASLAGTGIGIWSAVPNGAVTWPISHWDRIWLAYLQVYNAAKSLGMLSSAPDLKILGGAEVNAYALDGKTVAVTIGLSELISDSPSELAFALAHELGHIYQQQNGRKLLFHSNAEFDADVWGALLSLGAGFDPYGAAGALAKLSMATGRAGLATQFEDQLGSDAHKSFNERLENIFENLTAACNQSEEMKKTCASYKGVVHPHLPDVAPLARPGATLEQMERRRGR